MIVRTLSCPSRTWIWRRIWKGHFNCIELINYWNQTFQENTHFHCCLHIWQELLLILCITKQRTLYNSDKVLEPALNLQQGTLNSLRLQNSFNFRTKQTPDFLGNPISSRSGHLQSKTCSNAVNNPQIANRTMTTWHIDMSICRLGMSHFFPRACKSKSASLCR